MDFKRHYYGCWRGKLSGLLLFGTLLVFCYGASNRQVAPTYSRRQAGTRDMALQVAMEYLEHWNAGFRLAQSSPTATSGCYPARGWHALLNETSILR